VQLAMDLFRQVENIFLKSQYLLIILVHFESGISFIQRRKLLDNYQEQKFPLICLPLLKSLEVGDSKTVCSQRLSKSFTGLKGDIQKCPVWLEVWKSYFLKF
jgi:hypothetical protein